MSPTHRRPAQDAARSLASTCLLATALVVAPLSMALVAPASSAAQQSAGFKASQQVPQTSGATRQTSSPPAAIADNCSHDVTAALLKWIRSVPNGFDPLISRHGCYQVDGSLQISNRSNLTFEGNGSTFRGRNNRNSKTTILLVPGWTKPGSARSNGPRCQSARRGAAGCLCPSAGVSTCIHVRGRRRSDARQRAGI